MIELKDFGDGEIIESKIVGTVFKLSSYNKNPILTPQVLSITQGNAAIFNPGAEIFENRIILAPRCHKNYKKVKFYDKVIGIERDALYNYTSEIWFFNSKDGKKFERLENLILKGDGTMHRDFTYGIEDIRIIKTNTPVGTTRDWEELYFIIGCGKTGRPYFDRDSDRIAIYSTKDFKNISYHGIISSFDAHSMIPFPELVNGKLYTFFRFFPNIHLDIIKYGYDQLLEPTKYEKEWREIYNRRKDNIFIKTGEFSHESEKIGPGPHLVKTSRGWLLFYYAIGTIESDIATLYGVSTAITRCYNICCAVLDLENPKRILCRTKTPIYIPSFPYELYGSKQYPVDIPAVIFPTGIVQIDNKLLLYCGAGDKYCIVLSCDINNLLDYLFKYCYELRIKKT